MSKEQNIVSAIEDSRKVSDNGSLVTYDLTKGVDFSNPKKAAEALATVFFEKDAVNWFKVTGDHIEFDPAFKVRVVLAEEHNRKLEETVDDFLSDLQVKELFPTFSKQIKDVSANASKVHAAMIGQTISNLLFKHSIEKVYDDSIRDDLFLDILEKLEIRSLNNADLMDWKHLPL